MKSFYSPSLVMDKEQFDWFIDQLLKIPTCKIYAPLGDYDYHKCMVALDELFRFINSMATTIKIDSSKKEKIIERFTQSIYPMLEQEKVNILWDKLDDVLQEFLTINLK